MGVGADEPLEAGLDIVALLSRWIQSLEGYGPQVAQLLAVGEADAGGLGCGPFSCCQPHLESMVCGHPLRPEFPCLP